MGQERVLNQLPVDLEKKIFKGISANETKNPYRLEGLATSTSGYSFGWYHWDMAQRPDGQEYRIMEAAVMSIDQSNWDSAVRNAGLDPGAVTKDEVLREIRRTKGTPNNMVSAVKELINDELAKFSDAIDDLTVTQTKKFEADVNSFITTLRPEQQAYANNSDLFKVNFCDLINQRGPGVMNQFKNFLDNIQGELGLDDLVKFRVMYSPADQLRRFSNILEQEGISNILLTQEDARFLADDLLDILGKRYLSIIYDKKNDNWGIRGLIYKALSMWYNGYPCFEALNNYNQQGIRARSHQSFTGGEAFGRSPLILDLDGDGVETTRRIGVRLDI